MWGNKSIKVIHEIFFVFMFIGSINKLYYFFLAYIISHMAYIVIRE